MTQHLEQDYIMLNDTHSLYKFKINHVINIFLNIKACLVFYKAIHTSVLCFLSPDLSVWVMR
jgi:hypothetical protein